MELTSIISTDITTWVVIPILIFLARILDVSIGTLRVIFIARGMKWLASILGFFEVLIWLLAISQILQNLTCWLNYIAYAGGFAMGNFVGMTIENRLALGTVVLQIITRLDATELVSALRGYGYGVTSLDAEGKMGPVKVLFMLVARNELNNIINTVNKYNPHAFYSIGDVRFVSEGIFPERKKSLHNRDIFISKLFRKVK